MKPLTPVQEEEIKRSAGKESPQELAKRLGLSKKRVEQALASTARATRPAARVASLPVLLLGALLLLVLGRVAYATGSREYHYDDGHTIRDNDAIRLLWRKMEKDTRTDLSPGERVDRFFLALEHTAKAIWEFNRYRQLTYWSYALTYWSYPLELAQGSYEKQEDNQERLLAGWHAANRRIHLLNGLLVLWLAWLTLTSPAFRGSRAFQHPAAMAVLAALVFTLHPLQTQAVTYLAQRAESLCATFYLLALGLHATARVRALEGPRRGSAPWMTPALLGGVGGGLVLVALLGLLGALSLGGLVGAGVVVLVAGLLGLVALVRTGRDEPVHAACQAGCFLAFGLALNTKEIGATIPLAIVAWDLLFIPAEVAAPTAKPAGGRWWLPRLARTGLAMRGRDLGPWALAVAGVGILALAFGGANIASQLFTTTAAGGRDSGTTVSGMQYLLTQQNVLWTYLRMFVLPYGQSIDHDYPLADPSPGDPQLWLALLSMAGLATALVLVLRRGDRARVASFALLFLLTVLSVTSSVIVLPDVIYEHRVYLPLFGLALLLAVLVDRGVRTFVPAPVRQAALLGVAGVLAALLTGLTIARNEVWTTEVALWADVSSKSPDKPRAWCNYGLALMNAEELRLRFEVAANQTAEMNGSKIDLPPELGLSILWSSSTPGMPPFEGPTAAIRVLRLLEGGPEKARAAFDRALAIDPDYTKALNNKALTFLNEGKARRHEAQLLAMAAERAPDRATAETWMSRARASLERSDACIREARDAWERALVSQPYDPILLNNLGGLYSKFATPPDYQKAFELVLRSTERGPVTGLLTCGTLRIQQGVEAWQRGDMPAAQSLWKEAEALVLRFLEDPRSEGPAKLQGQQALEDVRDFMAGKRRPDEPRDQPPGRQPPR